MFNSGSNSTHIVTMQSTIHDPHTRTIPVLYYSLILFSDKSFILPILCVCVLGDDIGDRQQM